MAVAVALWAGIAAAAAPRADTQDAAGIAAMLGRIEQAIADKDTHAALATWSDETFVCVVDRPEHADSVARLTKEMITAVGAKMPGPGYEKRFILSWTGQIAPDLIGAICTDLSLVPPAVGHIGRQFMLCHYKQGQWRVCLSFPCFVEQRVMVEEIVPNGPAARLDVKPGDIVLRYGGRDVQTVKALQEAIKDHQGDNSVSMWPMVLRRGDQQVVVQCPAGPLGLRLDNRLEGELGTITLTGAAALAHAAAKPITDMYTAVRAKDAKALIAVMSGLGFVTPSVDKPGGPIRLAHAENAEQLLGTSLKASDEVMKAETLQAADIRLIIRGNLALVSWQVKGQAADGKPFALRELGCLVCFRGTWGYVAGTGQGEDTYRLGIEPEKK